MITNTKERIVAYVTDHQQVRVHDLVRFLNLSNMAVHKQVKRLVLDGVLQKVGKPPLVFYTLAAPEENSDVELSMSSFSSTERKIIGDHFLHITPDGRLLHGVDGFVYWHKLYQQKKSIAALAVEYVQVIDEKNKFASREGWIDATAKVTAAFDEQYIDHLLYADLYSYPMFGRTKLAKLVMYAKQSENRALIAEISTVVKPLLERAIKTFTIDAIAYIPPTVSRPVQFMSELARTLNLPLPEINLVKVIAGDVSVPQKTLARLDERVLNARTTIYIKHTAGSQYKNVLLIDDAAGSGASFHETAKKLRALHLGERAITAFALVGNIKGFDVIRQM